MAFEIEQEAERSERAEKTEKKSSWNMKSFKKSAHYGLLVKCMDEGQHQTRSDNKN
jgi:hypothetical protein